jgi:hypothetical protein
MKYTAIALLAFLGVALMPSIASADRYDRGDRYRGHRSGHSYRGHDRDRSSFSFSLGFGRSHGYRDYSHASFGYSRGHSHYRPTYYRAPVVVRERYYAPPPVVYYSAPARVYYDDCYRPSYYYRESRYSYCR